MRCLLLACLIATLSGCPDSRPPPTAPKVNVPEPTETAPAPPPTPATLKALRTAFEAQRDAFRAEPSPEGWEAAVAALDALRERAQVRFEELGGYDVETLDEEGEAALEILEDFEPVERDDLVRARPQGNQSEEPADAGSGDR